MAFRTNPAPYQRANRSTTQIMLTLLAALGIVWIAAIIYSFKLDGIVKAAGASSHYGLRAILLVIVSVLVTALSDVCTTIVKHKAGKDALKTEIIHDLKYNYSYITAVIFAMTLPVYTPIYVVIVGAVFATIVCKNFFGGFGKNIFNPAIMARIFVAICFASSLQVPEVLVQTSAGIDGVSGATLTTAFNNQSGWLATSYTSGYALVKNQIFSGYTLVDMLFGNYVGALGETFTILIFVLGIALSVLKVINWRTPVFYLGTVAVTTFVIALFCGFSNPFLYVLYHLSLGGLMFGAVFMLTDPVSGPTSQFGKAFIGVLAGFLTVLIRIKGGYPEGCMYSIAICNLVSPALDYFNKGRSNEGLVKKYSILGGGVLVSIILCTVLGVTLNGGKEFYGKENLSAPEYNFITESITIQSGDKVVREDNYVIKEGSYVADFDALYEAEVKSLDSLKATYEKAVTKVEDQKVKVAEAEGTDSYDAEVKKLETYEKQAATALDNVNAQQVKVDTAESYKALSNVYDILDSTGKQIGKIYFINMTNEIKMDGFASPVKTYALVAVTNEGQLYGMKILNSISSSGYRTDEINEIADNMTEAQYEDSSFAISGASYSAKNIKTVIKAAIDEITGGNN